MLQGGFGDAGGSESGAYRLDDQSSFHPIVSKPSCGWCVTSHLQSSRTGERAQEESRLSMMDGLPWEVRMELYSFLSFIFSPSEAFYLPGCVTTLEKESQDFPSCVFLSCFLTFHDASWGYQYSEITLMEPEQVILPFFQIIELLLKPGADPPILA